MRLKGGGHHDVIIIVDSVVMCVVILLLFSQSYFGPQDDHIQTVMDQENKV